MTLGTKKVFQALNLQGHTLYGSAAASGILAVSSTSHATKGKFTLGTSAYDEVNDRLGIGTAAPEFKLQIESSVATHFNAINTNATPAPGGGAGLSGSISTSPTASGQRLGFFTFGGFLSGTQRNAASIEGFAAESWTAGSVQGAYVIIGTTPTGSASRTERLRVHPDGTLGVIVGGIFGAVAGTALTNAYVALEVNSTTKAFLLPRMSATQRDAMTAVDGMVVYLASGTGSPAIQGRVNGAWVPL